jgi:hypothetical protein
MTLQQSLKEYKMFGDNKKVKDKVNFNKFFPTNNAFVNVDGQFKDAKDWWVDVTLQTGIKEVTQLWISDFKPQESIKQLKAYIEAAEKAIAFAEKCMSMQPAKVIVAKKPAKKK